MTKSVKKYTTSKGSIHAELGEIINNTEAFESIKTLLKERNSTHRKLIPAQVHITALHKAILDKDATFEMIREYVQQEQDPLATMGGINPMELAKITGKSPMVVSFLQHFVEYTELKQKYSQKRPKEAEKNFIGNHDSSNNIIIEETPIVNEAKEFTLHEKIEIARMAALKAVFKKTSLEQTSLEAVLPDFKKLGDALNKMKTKAEITTETIDAHMQFIIDCYEAFQVLLAESKPDYKAGYVSLMSKINQRTIGINNGQADNRFFQPNKPSRSIDAHAPSKNTSCFIL